MGNRFGLNIKSSVRDSKMSLAFKESEAQLPGASGKRRPVTNTSGGESPGDLVEHGVGFIGRQTCVRSCSASCL